MALTLDKQFVEPIGANIGCCSVEFVVGSWYVLQTKQIQYLIPNGRV